MPSHRTVLAFQVDDIRFGLAVESVVAVVRATALTALPGAPSVVEGLVNYRGLVIPVFDVARRFTGRARELRASHAFVIADTLTRRVALHVDVVDGLVESDADVSTAPVSLPDDVPITGVARTPDGLLILQDLARFLSSAESWALDRALRQALSASAAGT
ncbi:MAG TPA: chemotaxis protein CheW [Gemmatimonadaceae bacterium]|nr:chemotaxis protein CheW [Gemmatimonadaceae bacterium]